MTKRILGGIMIFSSIISAQATQKDDAFLGAKLGMNIANCTNSDADPRIGLNVGVFGQYFFTDKFAIEGDILYSQQGCKESMNYEGFNTDVTVKLDYLAIPVLAKYYPLSNGINVYAGPQFGFAVNTKGKVSLNGNSVETKMDNVNTFDFGFVIGAGYDFDFGLLIDIRYNPGVSKVLQHVDTSDNGRNSVFTIGVGYKF